MLMIKSLFLSVFFLIFATGVHAHANHDDVKPITQTEAASAAKQVLKSLVDSKKLDESWKIESLPETTSKKMKTENLWESTYRNPKEKDTAKRTLYIYFDAMGAYIGAGHEPITDNP